MAAGETLSEGLHVLAGKEPSDELRRGVGALSALNERARGAFWEVLEPALSEPLHPQIDALVQRFAEQYEAPMERVVPAIQSCRLLLREAARRRLGAELFAADLSRLTGEGDAAPQEVLLPKYDAAIAALHSELLRASLTDHGELLTRVDWRVDVMKRTQRGGDLDTPVVWMTLHYAKGEKKERITLQVLPDMLQQLMSMCQQVLS